MAAATYVFDKDAFEKALESNQELQKSILQRLKVLQEKKLKNRQQAAVLVEQLRVVPHVPASTAASEPSERSTAYNSFKWERSFFQGPDHTCPEPNQDTIDRRMAQERYLLRCNNHPWSPSELKQLGSVIKELQKEEEEKEADSNPSGATTTNDPQSSAQDTFYARVAQRLVLPSSSKLPPATKRPAAKRRASNTTRVVVQRSAQECRLAHVGMQKTLFDKKQRQELFHVVQEASMVRLETTGRGRIDWSAVARRLNNRSAWECFHEYQLYQHKQNPKTTTQAKPWTLLQDELLFTYVAALGPQVVLDGTEMARLRSSAVFRDKSKAQLFLRINQSLLNPNLKHDAWNEEEERRLALCMKIYSDQQTDNLTSSGTSKALYFAGTHIAGRSGTSVNDKWNRSLNPAFSARPFTKEEDQALLHVMRQHVNFGWVEIARQFFPDRHPHRLMNRWSEIATDDDIVNRCAPSLLLPSSATKSSRLNVGGTEATNDDTNLTANDLVVQVRKRKR